MRARDDRLCIGLSEPLTWGAFAADVAATRARIAGADTVCNLLKDRYGYMVGLAAALLNGQTTVLPPAAAPGAVAAALDGAEAPLVLGGDAAPEGTARRIQALPLRSGLADPAALHAALAAAPGEVHVFTSGSTGHPVRHRKRWRTLAGGAAVTETVLAAAGLSGQRFAILGTTPHQHMYGLEATVFTGLAHGRVLHRGTVFYPADLELAVAEAEAAGIGRCVLVTSPTHLRFLEPAIAQLPQIGTVISATAPLPGPLAARIEAGGTRVFEIYGSTETGSIAMRRTVDGPVWRPLAGFVLDARPEGCTAEAPHLAQSVLLGDAIQLEPGGGFRLLGRLGDMVSIAGKRSSLGTLNAVLAETPGLADGVVIRARGEDGDFLGVVAVAAAGGPGAAALRAAIREQFRKHVDPVFQPQRIRFVARLPRSGTGKISKADRQAMLDVLTGAP